MEFINLFKNLKIYNFQMGKVIDYDPVKDKLLELDLTASNNTLTPEILADTAKFSSYIFNELKGSEARYGIGGYNEHRTIYNRSSHFDPENTFDEPRRLHLGVDIWGPAGTPVYNFSDGVVYGCANNNNFGDYGGTIIIKYNLEGNVFYALFGHLSEASVKKAVVGQRILKGENFAEFGNEEENGHWPPHLHFQLILDMEGNSSDYPGVCRFSERNKYLANCPDPMMILKNSLLKRQP